MSLSTKERVYEMYIRAAFKCGRLNKHFYASTWPYLMQTRPFQWHTLAQTYIILYSILFYQLPACIGQEV